MTISAITLTNPGAEAGNTSGWTARLGSGFAAVTTQGGVTPHSGSYFFLGGTSSDNVWDQQIAVDPGIEAAIDADLAAVKFDGWHNSFSGDADRGRLYVEFYNAAVVKIGSTQYDPDDTSPNVWTLETFYVEVPALTRFIRFGTYNFRVTGTNNDSYWDDFTAEISDDRQADYPTIFNTKIHQLLTYAFGAAEETSGDFLVSVHQLGVYAWANQAAEQTYILQLPIYAFAAAETSTGLFHVRVHQLALYAWVAERPRRRRMQAWTFSLDGHDFYVLDLAGEGTVVCDLATGQWSEWRSADELVWRARIGQNWLGIGPDTVDRLYGTNVVCGDNTDGILWILDPTQGFDDATTEEGATQPFIRYVTGLVPARMRDTQSCAAVYINLSLGAPTVTGASINLRTSDDGGQSYYDHGSVVIDPNNYTQEVAFRGLGLIRAQGRVFEITDSGAAVRINAANMK